MFSRLAAQDAIVTDPAWLDPEEPPADVLPGFKKRPKPSVPDEVEKGGAVAYALVYDTLDENGKRLATHRQYTNPYLESETGRALAMDAIKFVPAKRDGDAVMTTCWYALICNPRSAAEGKSDATPRVLAVAPVVVKKKNLPADAKLPLVIWATLSIDEKGQLQNYVFEDAAYEPLRPQVGGSLHLWKFAAARKDGQPVAAELKVPLILNQQYSPKLPGVPPKKLVDQKPRYPRSMLATRLRGEVLVEFVVDKDGSVKEPKIARSSNPGFNEAAIDAILGWKFEPGRKGGLPVATRMQQPFTFDVTDGNLQGRDLFEVKTNKKAQENLPEQLRYDIAPKPKGVLMPVYPHSLLAEKTKGKVTVAFLVDERGGVSEVKVIEATHPEFGQAMIAAVEAFAFIPAMRDGKPTATILRMEQDFHPNGRERLVPEKDEELLNLEKKHPEKIVPAAKLDGKLTPVSRRGPVFPSALRGSTERGEAKIEVLINEEGKVCLPRIVQATDPAFGYAAVQAVAEWRFEPPIAGGKPVIARAVLPFVFKNEKPKHAPEVPVPEQKAP